MPANMLLAIGCIALAAGLFFLSWKGWIKNVVVERVEKVAGLVAVLIGIVAFIDPFASQGAATPTNQVVYQGPASSNITAITGEGDVEIKGDFSTQADKRYADALISVTDELSSNFTKLAVVTRAVADHPPQPFWDSRRVNETELAYQDRAVAAFRDYRTEIDQMVQMLGFSTTTLRAFEHDLGHNAEVAQHIKDAYARQDEAVYALTSYVTGLQHEIALNNSDIERAARSASWHREKVAAARLALATAAASFCLVTEQDSALQTVAEALKLASMPAQLQPGEEGYRAAMQLAATYASERVQVLQERLDQHTQAAARKIDRRVTDPYLILVREAAGLPPTLTITEVVRLQNKQIDQEETQPEKLLALAALSYIESDGEASEDYFRRAIASGQLSQTHQRYAELSIHRMQQPDKYDGSIGLMVMRLVPGGNFATAGVQVGDVIIALNNAVVNEPMEVASALLPPQPLLLTVVRDGERTILPVQGGQSAGATLSQLIILQEIQL